MKLRASADGRVRNSHQYHGASTGRWAGRGLQVQNFPRGRKHSKDDGKQIAYTNEICDLIANGDKDRLDIFYGPTMDAIADSLRGMLIAPPGHELIASDFSAIEARVLAWLAGEESVLDVFRGHGKIYEHAAAGIYHVPAEKVTKEQRQIGKVAILACGYGGGVGAFQAMARNYHVRVKDEEAESIKKAWRESHPRIVRYWYDLEEAAILTLKTGGKCSAGARGREVVFKKSGSFLWAKLPSGRVICYPYPELRTVTTPWGSEKESLTFMTELADPKKAPKLLPDENSHGKWQRISTYGGSLAENMTQAVARDILRDAMFRLESKGFGTILHVHDECVVEVPSPCDDRTVRLVETIMAEVPAWASGLPLAAEGWHGPRYRK